MSKAGLLSGNAGGDRLLAATLGIRIADPASGRASLTEASRQRLLNALRRERARQGTLSYDLERHARLARLARSIGARREDQAPNYAKARSALAKQMGLGQQRRKAK